MQFCSNNHKNPPSIFKFNIVLNIYFSFFQSASIYIHCEDDDDKNGKKIVFVFYAFLNRDKNYCFKLAFPVDIIRY